VNVFARWRPTRKGKRAYLTLQQPRLRRPVRYARCRVTATSWVNLGDVFLCSACCTELLRDPDLISFGRPFITNPDLVERFRNGWLLAEPAPVSDWSSPSGAKGYTDFPVHAVPSTRS
jgi:2,4-dienoyl-CoA reductase-like NADH-dependent reductase (Old Yellow Enzyme family)